MNPLVEGFKAATRPPDRRKVWEWCESHLIVDSTSPMPGRWRSDSSPWVKEPMEVFSNNRVSDVGIMCSAQSSKTQTAMGCACYAIAEDPGPAMWVMAAADEAKTFVRDRIKPTFDNCEPVASQMATAESLEFTFNSMPFYFTGAGSRSKLQSKPIRWLFLDEVRNYPPGALDLVLKRTRAFWNSRRLVVSTPDALNDAVHRFYLLGDQRVYNVACPHCNHLQPLVFEQLKAMHPHTRQACKFAEVPGAREGQRWNFDVLADWIRYECVGCKRLIADTPTSRKFLAKNGRFVSMNPTAPKHRVSFHWNALLPPWVSWRSIVEEFINARASARSGDLEPLKAFINETLGLPWEDKLGEIDDFDFLEDRRGDYDFGAPWAEERTRFMSADRQQSGGEHYWWVIRAFGLFGKSRLIAYGSCKTLDELEQIRKEYNVSAANSVIDSGFRASEIYRFCLATGWKAFKGDEVEYFLHKDPKTGRTFRRVWRRTFQDPHYGTKMAGRVSPIPLFNWSNPAVKDMLADQMLGLVGGWTIPQATGRDYFKQITAEKRCEREDAKGRITHFWKKVRRDDHIRDCELMIFTAAIISKTVQSRPETALPPATQTEAAPASVPA